MRETLRKSQGIKDRMICDMSHTNNTYTFTHKCIVEIKFKYLFPSSGHTFIKFYAPWCGHCQMMEPDWEEVGEFVSNHQDMFPDRSLTIGEVDITNISNCSLQIWLL